jgi:pyruvate formate lyase activating enzyme
MDRNKIKIDKREFLKRSLALVSGLYCLPCPFLFSETRGINDVIYKREAMFQENSVNGIICRICPNKCMLKEGESSKCRNRRVYNSKLYTLAYGNPCAANIDPIEKKPLYHFFPGSRIFSIATAGCNLSCLNCQNWTISQTSPDMTRNFDLMPQDVIEECKKNGCKSIAYTYSEPTTFYEYMFDTATLAKREGLKNVIKSNGYINPEPLKKLCSVINAANIDLKAFSDSTYRRLSGGRLQPVLDSIKTYNDLGVWLEITNLVVPTWSDNLEEIGKMCKWLGENGFKNVPLHFSRFYPMYKLEQLPATPVDTLNEAVRIAKGEGIKYVYTGNVPGNELSDTICPKCNSPVITRQGFMVVSNNIKAGCCGNCNEPIEGVWQ